MFLRILKQNIIKKLSLSNHLSNVPLASCTIHTNAILSKKTDLKNIMATVTKRDEGTRGEGSIDIDNLLTGAQDKVNIFPDANLPNRLFNGIPFKELPICNVRVSRNNTIVNFTDYKGKPVLTNSCGIEGYKNARKGTNIAAQATAMTISGKALERGWNTIRVVVRGLGPGRMAAIKGLQMGGLNVVSVTDATRVSYYPPRPRKARRL